MPNPIRQEFEFRNFFDETKDQRILLGRFHNWKSGREEKILLTSFS